VSRSSVRLSKAGSSGLASTPSSDMVMRLILSSVSGVKMFPSSTTKAIATTDEEPKVLENLSWAWMKGWSG
jgi:hypothetical protein